MYHNCDFYDLNHFLFCLELNNSMDWPKKIKIWNKLVSFEVKPFNISLTTGKLSTQKMDRRRKALEEAKEDLKDNFKPDRNPGPTVKELRFIWDKMQNLLEDSAYVGNKIPKSQGNKADFNAFLLQKRKFQRSKKFRSLMDDDDQTKVLLARGTGSG